MKSWQASAPSNIALIKYMGKVDSTQNLPTNSSISLTLNKLLTYVHITEDDKDQWLPLQKENTFKIELSEKGEKRFLSNWLRLKQYFQIEGNYLIQSASNFPADCGIASSASSFAALTMAAFNVAQDKGSQNLDINKVKLAELSREASGSSCRSFFEPFCVWSDSISKFYSAYENLFHFVVIVNGEKKKVSSSDAHKLVVTSDLFKGRPERANHRLELVKNLLNEKSLSSWEKLYEVCWQEFWDMHALFETSQPPFGYLTTGSIEVLNLTRNLWQTFKDGPIVTMDAGPNIHFIWRQDQHSIALAFKAELEKSNYKVIVGNE